MRVKTSQTPNAKLAFLHFLCYLHVLLCFRLNNIQLHHYASSFIMLDAASHKAQNEINVLFCICKDNCGPTCCLIA